MHRYALQYLEEKWFVDPSRKPLILRGARQTGKTWLAREFAKRKEFAFIELNFERNPELKSLFESNDPKVVLRNIESYKGIRINLETSLLFLDEIQDAPEVLSKLRWFYEEVPELPVIAAGSLLEFILSDHSFSMPVGRISYLYIEPLSFEEFLLALDEHQLLNYIKTIELAFRIPDAIHQKLRGLFNLYCFVGGMPACVVKWIKTKTFLDIAPIQEDLIATYRDDFYKYKGRFDVSRLLSVLSSIPNQLGQKFMYSRTGSDMQANVAKQILTLFNRAKITHMVKLSSANTVPLSSAIKDKAFKQIFLDVGLVNRMLSKPFQPTLPHTAQDGGISEQVVGQMLRTLFPLFKEPALYYWQREEVGASAEIDYLIECNGAIVPVEVKAGSSGRLKSLHSFMYQKQKKLAVRINDDLLSVTEVDVKLPTQESVSYTLLSIPFYLTSQVTHLIRLCKIELIKDLVSKNRVPEAFDILLGVFTSAEESLTTIPKGLLDDLIPIIQTVALHKDLLSQVCDLLWLMSKHYDASSQSLSANDKHPIRILKNVFSYKPDKPLDYLTVAVDWAIKLLETYNAEEYPFSPFVFLGEIMKTFGTIIEGSASSITSTGFTIDDHEFVAQLRSKIIEAVLKTLASSDTKKAYEAAKFVSDCLTYDENEKNPWTEEALNTLDKLNYVVKNEKIKGYALIALSLQIDQLNLQIDQLLLKGEYPITRLLRDIQTQIHKTIQADKELCMIAIMMDKWNWLQSKDKTHVKTYGDIINSIFDKSTMNLNASYDLVNSKYREISLIDKNLKDNFQHLFRVICETKLDFSEHCVQQALSPQENDRLWQFAWISLSMLLHYDRSNGQEYAAKLLISSDKNQRELVGQAFGELPTKDYPLDDFDNAIIKQILNDSDESVISSGLIFIKKIASRDRNYPKALDLLIRIRKDVSHNILGEMFEIVRNTPLNYHSNVSTLKTKDQDQEMFPKIIFERLCEYLITLQRIPFGYNDGIEAFLLKLTSVYPEVVLELVLKRSEYALENKLFERTFFTSYQIIDMQFLNRETSGVFPLDHSGVKNSKTLLSAWRNLPNIKNTINQWLKDHSNGSKSYENVKEFLRVTILGELAVDKRSDRRLTATTDHIFEKTRGYINKSLLNNGNKGWLAHDEVDTSMNEYYGLVEDAFLAVDKLTPEERNFAVNKWIESSEIKKFEEEIKPIYELFKGYLKADHRIINHSIDCFNTQAMIIPCKRADTPLKQRYAVQLFSSQETPQEMKIPSRLKFCGVLEQYDGCIEFSDGVQQKVEVTVANKAKEQGRLKTDMRQNGYAMHPMNDENKMALQCLDAIKNKLDKDKHRDKYAECWLVVVLNGWQLESIEDLESFLPFFKEVLEKEKYTIDWTQIKSIILYPGN